MHDKVEWNEEKEQPQRLGKIEAEQCADGQWEFDNHYLGVHYKGEMHDGKPNGQGQWEDGHKTEKYEGGFKDGRYHGEGILHGFIVLQATFEEGRVARGVPFKICSRHTMSDMFEGSIKEDMVDSVPSIKVVGTMTSRHDPTSVCTGEWIFTHVYRSFLRMHLRLVKGTYHRANKLVYDGEWLDGRYHGQGTLYGDDGEVVAQGCFKRDELFIESCEQVVVVAADDQYTSISCASYSPPTRSTPTGRSTLLHSWSAHVSSSRRRPSRL